MKRILALSLSAALVLSLLCSCGSADDPETTVITPDPTGESASVPPADTTQEPSLALPGEEPTEEVSEEPSVEPSDGPSQEPSQAPASQAPSPTPAPTLAPTHHPEETHHVEPTHHPEETHHVEPTHHPEPTPTPAPTPVPTPAPTPTPAPSVPPIVVGPGFGGNTEPSQAPSAEPSKAPDGFFQPSGPSASDIDLENFLWRVLDRYEFPGMDVLPDEWAANFYPGLLSIPVVQRLVCTPSMTGVAAELTLVQVANSSDAAHVRSLLEARRDAQVAGGAFYPAVVEQWERSCRIVANGNYIMLVVNADCDAIVADFNALF